MVKQIYGEQIDITSADVFTMKNEISYAAFIGILSNIYMKAHASSIIRDNKPYIAALVISEKMMEPYNDQPESSFNRLKAIIERMEQPCNKIIIGIFLSNDGLFTKESKLGLKHTVSHIWPLMNNHTYTKPIITINTPPDRLKKAENRIRYFNLGVIKKQLNNHPFQCIDYNTPINDVFTALDRSKLHICYQGGTAWLSLCMNIPTLIVHSLNNIQSFSMRQLKFRLFGQDLGNVNILNSNKLIEIVSQHPCEHHTGLHMLNKKIEELLK